MAAAAPAMGEVFKPNKYEEALRLYDLALEVKTDFTECCSRFDNLLRHFRENFVAPKYDEEHLAATHMAIKNKNYDEWRKMPPPILEAIYPVALMKMGLCHDHLYLNSDKMKESDWFCDVYKDLIFAASNRD